MRESQQVSLHGSSALVWHILQAVELASPSWGRLVKFIDDPRHQIDRFLLGADQPAGDLCNRCDNLARGLNRLGGEFVFFCKHRCETCARWIGNTTVKPVVRGKSMARLVPLSMNTFAAGALFDAHRRSPRRGDRRRAHFRGQRHLATHRTCSACTEAKLRRKTVV